MANKIREIHIIVDASNNVTASASYDVLDQSGGRTTLGQTIPIPLTVPQQTTILNAFQSKVDAQVAIDLAAARAQLTNTAAT